MTGRHRRADVPVDHMSDDEHVSRLVQLALNAAIADAAFEAPQVVYSRLQRELRTRQLLAPPQAVFDAAFQVSAGLRPVSLHAYPDGRRRRDAAPAGSPGR